MPKYAAFLRGINLGRQRRVSGAELRSQFEALDFGDVETFRTSGNVVFGAEAEGLEEMRARIEEGLAESLGYPVTTFLRTGSELRATAAHQPFAPSAVGASEGKLQVAFLSAEPAESVRERVLALATDNDRLAFAGRELYWLPSGGTRDSKLDMKTIEALVGPSTMRTKGTVEQMVAKHFDT